MSAGVSTPLPAACTASAAAPEVNGVAEGWHTANATYASYANPDGSQDASTARQMIIDAIAQPVALTPAQVRHIADRRRGVGCDQLLLVEPPRSPDTLFHYRIFNADGSEVNQCGNGARCVALLQQPGNDTARSVVLV